MGAVRFYLAMTVVLAHSAASSPVLDAHFSVLLFFAISGFCMALVLNEKYTEPSPARFYLARFFRLWPTYIVVAVLTWITLRPLGDATHANFWSALYFYFSSVSLFGHETLWWFSLPADGSVVAMDTTVRSPHTARMTQMQHIWSVGVELAFYTVSPLFARRPCLIAVLLPIAYGAHVALSATLDAEHPWLLRSALNYVWIFLLGMAAWWLWREWKDRLPTISHAAAVPAGIAFIILCTLIEGGTTGWLRSDFAIALFALALIPLFHASKDSAWDRVIGELSYPIYVVHWPLVTIALRSERKSILGLLLIASAVILAATLLHLLIQRPVDRWRSRLATGIGKYQPEPSRAAMRVP